ncbi:MAG: tyrosine-protein phosphatase [Gammaproteobacteria bacterium]
MDDILAIEITRTGERRHRVDWSAAFTSAPVTIYGGITPEQVDTRRPLARDAQPGLALAGLPARYVFMLEPAGGERHLAGARHLALEGAVNLRDLGGYATDDGRRVRWGRLYRSGHLSRLTPAAHAELADLDIRTVCDFRTATERTRENAVLPNAPRVVTLEVPPGRHADRTLHHLLAETDDPADVAQEVHALLRAFVAEFTAAYRRMFAALLAAEPAPVLLNCSAGKERTGVGMVLLLTALGVPRATIRADFLLSRRYFPAEPELARALQKYAVPGKDEALMARLLQPLIDTPDAYADTVLDALDRQVARYGDVPAFLRECYGVGPAERAHLRDTYTH